MKPFLFLLLLLTLASCAPPSRPPATPAAVDPAALRQQLLELPGASINPEKELTVFYPGESLFAEGAALPLPGGTAVLDPLAALLAANPGVRVEGTVRAHKGISAAYDEALARKREELLERFFLNRGVAGDRLSLRAEAGEGPPLELTLSPIQPSSVPSVSGEKR